MVMEYRCATVSVTGFVQQLAVNYVTHGYWRYASGLLPEGKNLVRIDEKLVDKYGIDVSMWARARRKKKGLANLQYIRHGRFFVLIATEGAHPIFLREEGAVLRDVREIPICYAGYAIGYRGGHAQVRIEQGELNRLRSYFLDIAVHRRADSLARELRALPFVGYASIRSQLYTLFLDINKKRATMGYEPVPHGVLNFERPIVYPFGGPAVAATSVADAGDPLRACP